MKYDVVVIGSGFGGLACAQILARQGRSVLVIERHVRPGGCLQSYLRRRMGYDTGLHYVGGLSEGQSMHDAFKELGLLRLPWQHLDADGFDKVTICGSTFCHAEGFETFAETLAQDFPKERDGLFRYVELLQRPEPKMMAVNAYDWLNATFHDPLLIDVLCGTSLKMELRRESLPLFTFLHTNGSFVESSWRLKGDGNLLVNTLVEGIEGYGGKVVCGAEVQELIEQGGKVIAARCSNGEVYEGELFVSDIHPSLLCALVGEQSLMKPRYRRRIACLEDTCGMLTVSLRVAPGTLRYFNCNHYVWLEPDVWEPTAGNGRRVKGVMVSCRAPVSDSEYTQQVDLLTPMTWNQCQPWDDTRVGRRGKGYEEMKRRMADECIAAAEQVLPGLGGIIREQYISTPLTYRDYTLAPHGSAWGIRKDCRQPMLTFLSPQTPIPNLLMTGQSLMVHGLHGVAMTALQTCRIIKDYGK